MKVLIQIVKEAKCVIEDKIYSNINKGVCIFVGFNNTDNEQIVTKMIEKIIKLRIFPDSEGKTNLNLETFGGSILSISQFTLYADLKGTNRPSFTNCCEYNTASNLYGLFNEQLSKENINLKTGVFGADMEISLVNDGPFTIMLDSSEVLK